MGIVDLGVNPELCDREVQYIGDKQFNYPCSICPDDCQGHVIELPPTPIPEPVDWSWARLEKNHILSCLAAHKQNRTHAANALGISVRTLQRKLKDWGKLYD